MKPARALRHVWLALALLGSFALTAQAEKLPRTEQGNVLFVFLSGPVVGQGQVQVSTGDIVWEDRIIPALWVELQGPTPVVKQPVRGAALKPGTALFGVELSTGWAYCAPYDPDRAVRRAQCLRDLNDDGNFEGVYVGEARGGKSRYLPAILRALQGMNTPPPYTRLEPNPDWAVPAKVTFAGWRETVPTFFVWIEDERIDTPLACEIHPTDPGRCRVLGVEMNFAPADEDLLLEVTRVAASRSFETRTFGITRLKRNMDWE
jgi:hypothetical protein